MGLLTAAKPIPTPTLPLKSKDQYAQRGPSNSTVLLNMMAFIDSITFSVHTLFPFSSV
jgi:hypothetical protein